MARLRVWPMLEALFLAAFLAATILPAQSEAVLLAALAAGHPALLVVGVASLGNILGAATTFALGWVLGPRLPIPERARNWFARWGRFSLLLSWLPVLGDGLVIAAGVARTAPVAALGLVALGKGGRYALLAWGAQRILGTPVP